MEKHVVLILFFIKVANATIQLHIFEKIELASSQTCFRAILTAHTGSAVRSARMCSRDENCSGFLIDAAGNCVVIRSNDGGSAEICDLSYVRYFRLEHSTQEGSDPLATDLTALQAATTIPTSTTSSYELSTTAVTTPPSTTSTYEHSTQEGSDPLATDSTALQAATTIPTSTTSSNELATTAVTTTPSTTSTYEHSTQEGSDPLATDSTALQAATTIPTSTTSSYELSTTAVTTPPSTTSTYEHLTQEGSDPLATDSTALQAATTIPTSTTSNYELSTTAVTTPPSMTSTHELSTTAVTTPPFTTSTYELSTTAVTTPPSTTSTYEPSTAAVNTPIFSCLPPDCCQSYPRYTSSTDACTSFCPSFGNTYREMKNTMSGGSYTEYVQVTLDECKNKCTAALCTAFVYRPTTMICRTHEALVYHVYEQGPGDDLYIRNCA